MAELTLYQRQQLKIKEADFAAKIEILAELMKISDILDSKNTPETNYSSEALKRIQKAVKSKKF